MVGCGDLGSRHIQGLFASNYSLEIIAYDPSDNALLRCQERLNSIDYQATDSTINFINSLKQLTGHFDIVLVATTSIHRLQVVCQIINQFSFDHLILEKLLTCSQAELVEFRDLLGSIPNVVVNCPRRIMDWHSSLKNYILSKYCPVRLEVNIGGHELATNLIHFTDFASWIVQSEPSECISQTLGNWQPAKRTGFYDLSGFLEIKYKNDFILSINCSEHPVDTTLSFFESSSTPFAFVNEVKGLGSFHDGTHINGTLSYQSTLTGKIVDNILDSGISYLPSFSDSYPHHSILLSIFEDHWNSQIDGRISHSLRIT